MENKNTNSNVPFAIIGIVLLVALVGGWWFYQNSKETPTKPKTENANKTPVPVPTIPPSASVGAQPPNMLGSPTAAVTVEEFADYQCPTCGLVHPKMKEITGYYGNRIKFVYRNFPLTQIHKNAYDAAVASEAAGMQGKFWAMQDQLYNNRQAWESSPEPRKIFDEYAQKIGLDVTKFQNDMLGMAAKQRVDADLQRGRSAGVDGTPAIYINGKKLGSDQMDFSVMRQMIDTELAKANQSQPNNAGQPVNNANPVNSSETSNSSSNEKK